MPNGEVEKLTVSIEADVSDLLADTKKGVDRAERELQDLEKTGSKTFKTIGESAKRAFNIAIDGVKRFGASAKRAFQGAVNGAKRLTANFGGLKTAAVAFIAAFSVAKITGFFKESIELTKTQIAAEKQLETVLKSTGNAVGLTADELKKMASELQNVTNFGDEATIAAQAILLTFTSIGKEVFPGATKAILDVSTAMGQDLRTSAIQIGKALNDPIAGLGALRRVGIQFTDQQEEQIRTLTKSGQIVEAQTIILGELERQFGGSAEAARQADGGFIAFSNTIGDLQELLGLPVFEALADWALK
jgi:phage-related minor tail protein